MGSGIIIIYDIYEYYNNIYIKFAETLTAFSEIQKSKTTGITCIKLNYF